MSIKKNINKLTTQANLSFNVNCFRKYLMNVFELFNCQKPKCNKAHVYLACFNELLCRKIIENVQEHLSKDSNGLFKITRQALKYSIELNINLNKCLFSHILTYDETLLYENKYPISKQTVVNFIERNFGTDIFITQQAYDFLSYILVKTSNHVIINLIELLKYSGKKTLNYSTILHAVRLELKNSECIRDEFVRKLEETHILFGNTKDEKDNDEKDDDEKDDDEKDDDDDDNNDNDKKNNENNDNNKDNDNNDDDNNKNKNNNKNENDSDNNDEDNKSNNKSNNKHKHNKHSKK